MTVYCHMGNRNQGLSVHSLHSIFEILSSVFKFTFQGLLCNECRIQRSFHLFEDIFRQFTSFSAFSCGIRYVFCVNSDAASYFSSCNKVKFPVAGKALCCLEQHAHVHSLVQWTWRGSSLPSCPPVHPLQHSTAGQGWGPSKPSTKDAQSE